MKCDWEYNVFIPEVSDHFIMIHNVMYNITDLSHIKDHLSADLEYPSNAPTLGILLLMAVILKLDTKYNNKNVVQIHSFETRQLAEQFPRQ